MPPSITRGEGSLKSTKKGSRIIWMAPYQHYFCFSYSFNITVISWHIKLCLIKCSPEVLLPLSFDSDSFSHSILTKKEKKMQIAANFILKPHKLLICSKKIWFFSMSNNVVMISMETYQLRCVLEKDHVLWPKTWILLFYIVFLHFLWCDSMVYFFSYFNQD